MAASDARPIPRKNTAFRVTFPLYDADGDLVTGAGSLDSEVSKDGGAMADCTNEATEIGSSGIYYLDLTADEMNADTVAIIVKSSSAKTLPLTLYPEEAGDVRVDVVQISGDSSAADNLETATDGGSYNVGGGAIVAASVTGAVGSVTGNVGGNVTGSVGSVATGGIAAASFAAGAIDAAAIAANAIGESELAAGAITTSEVATGAIDADALAADAVDEILDEVTEGSTTLRQAIRILMSFAAAKASGGGSSTITFRDIGDTKDRIVMTVDSDGDRTAVTLDAS